MINYLAIRTISVILGLSAMFVAFVVFLLDLVASINNVDPTNDYAVLALIILLILSGAVTIAAPTFIFKQHFKKFFIPTCIVLGIGYIVGFFLARDTLSVGFELFLLSIALLYFVLAYLSQQFSVE